MSYAIIYCRGRVCVAFTMDLGFTPVRSRKCDSNIEKFLFCASISDFDGLEKCRLSKSICYTTYQRIYFSLDGWMIQIQDCFCFIRHVSSGVFWY